MKKIFTLAVVATLIASTGRAQSTYTSVYNLFQAHCASCHTGTTPPGALDLSGSSSQVYTALFNVSPNNAIALAKGDKRIQSGRPHSSFLLRKIQNNLDADNGLTTGEGNACPQSGPMLQDKDIEKIRQWIYHGAPQTGNVVDTNTINMFYAGQGFLDTITNGHPLPTAPGSYQLHIGKMFLAPNDEVEYFLKYKLNLPDTIEVNRVELFMGQYSHHFILYKFLPGAAPFFPDSMRIQNPQTGQGSSTGYNSLVAAWQSPLSYNLPTGTAYQWETSTALDYNNHLFNPSNSLAMAEDVYINVYTQPKNTAQSIMHSDLITDQNIYIPATGTNITFQQSDYDVNATANINIWLLSTHTHKYGVDFDIYKRNANNTTGQQVFEGWYNTYYTFNQGYYDWQHPPVEIFPNFLTIDPRLGLIQEATFNNWGSQPVQFGLTTNDEMMLYFMQYTYGTTLGVPEYHSADEIKLNAYPNPYHDKTAITYELKNSATVSVEVFDVLGQKVATLTDKELQQEGKHSVDLSAKGGVNSGIYFVNVTIDGITYAQRIIETK